MLSVVEEQKTILVDDHVEVCDKTYVSAQSGSQARLSVDSCQFGGSSVIHKALLDSCTGCGLIHIQS